MFYRVRQIRSVTGMPPAIRKTMAALGLAKRGRVVYLRISAGSAGQILKVKELVEVELVNNSISIQEERKLRSPEPGFKVIGSQ